VRDADSRLWGIHHFLEIVLPAEDKRPLIRLESVSKVFQTEDMETHALVGTHIEIAKGDYVAISGPSGCGKSTLLAILGLLDTPSSGSYFLNDVSVHELGAAQRARIRNREIGFIFQAFNLIGDLTVAQNVELPLIYRSGDGKLSRSDRRNQVQEALEQVGIAHRLNHYPAQLSGGQQQRVAVARALAGKPSILLADEPTGNLDSRNGEAVMELLENLHQSGSTICMVTHDHRFAKVAKRGICMFDGRIVDEDALDQLRHEETHRIERMRTGTRVPECV
jgi:putative ABC transport system ATP-binding protein